MIHVLAIETSCDDTSVAILRDTQILSNLISSQIKAHQPHGGVVPELASRMHAEKLPGLIERALKDAQIQYADLNYCAVTVGPGLEGSLLIGFSAASALSEALQIPLIGINHLHAHLYATFLSDAPPTFPFIGCIVSGGHTQLILAKDHFNFELIGETRDDAAGEAFDKVARALNLGYPGGPIIEKTAQIGNPKAVHFPRAMRKRGLEFSFSGLKTAVIQYIESQPTPNIPDICASFQAAVIDTLTEKCLAACEQYASKTLVLCGGVSANQTLRTHLQSQCDTQAITLHVPSPVLCTDNAAMIGIAAFHTIKNNPNTLQKPTEVYPNLAL